VGDGNLFQISNSIFDGCGGNFFGGSFQSNGYNIDTGSSCGFAATGDQQNVDPLLAALADNGGFTKTLALLAGSLAINAANPATPTGSGGTCETTDQRGTTRPQGTACDIGAFEYIFPAPAPAPTPTPTLAPSGGGGMIVGSGPSAPSEEGINKNVPPPRPQTDYPNGTIVYLGATTTASTTSPSSTQPQPSPMSAPTASFLFTQNQQLHDRGTDIRTLQQFLNTHDFPVAPSGSGSPGHETDIFGLKTFQALKKFQQAHDLPPTGYLGPLTRTLISQLP
jgi:hypothetical protein